MPGLRLFRVLLAIAPMALLSASATGCGDDPLPPGADHWLYIPAVVEVSTPAVPAGVAAPAVVVARGFVGHEHFEPRAVRGHVRQVQRVAVAQPGGVQPGAVVVDRRGAVDHFIPAVVDEITPGVYREAEL